MYEIVAASRGTLTTEKHCALRLAWGLACNERPWESNPLALPELPANVLSVYDIPRAVTILSSDGRFDGDEDGRQRDLFRPDVAIEGGAAIWRPLEMGMLEERIRGQRFLRIEPRDPYQDATISWDSGSDAPSRFIGRCLVAALGSLDLSYFVGVLTLRRIDERLPFPHPLGGAL